MQMRLLIANRGEIAVRIARGARRVGVGTVAVYSDPDRTALHVGMCDAAVRIGPADAAASYLSVPALLDAAARSGATAVHPGYGFLAENAAFATAVLDAGLTWVGPHPAAIEAMGSKINARRVAREAGVPIIPGFSGSQSDRNLAAAAVRIGYPVMIKASAGGGGKGIRIASTEAEFAVRLHEAREEGRRAFGDDAMIVERFITRPRHIEVQVVGDRRGTVLHLGTRECSIQRRHQKVIEEAPAPWLPPETREGLHDAAVALARAIGYDNAGTVEFIVDAETGEFYFLEMNTRLQVEHPVTESVTGVDLVELQLIAASGRTLPMTQEDIVWSGHAMEARLNAEDPWQGFMPQTGTVSELEVPEGVRWDSGIARGSEVTPHYDSMVAKLIAHGRDRDTARQRLLSALDDLHVVGLRTNQAFLGWLLRHPAVVKGPVTTRFLDEEPLPDPPDEAAAARLVALAHLASIDAAAADGPWTASGAVRFTPHPAPRSVCLEGAGARHALSVGGFGGRYDVDGWTVTARRAGSDLLVDHDGTVERFRVSTEKGGLAVSFGGTSHSFRLVSREERWLGAADHDASGTGDLLAPFPGLVVSVDVEPGAEVHEGQTLVTLEAMKMLHTLSAAGHGVVEAVLVGPGTAVEQRATLVTFVPQETPEEE